MMSARHRVALRWASTLTDEQVELMAHALGWPLRSMSRPERRNHFVAGREREAPVWDELVTLGLAKKHRNSGTELSGGDPVYNVTDAGKDALHVYLFAALELP